VDFPLLLRQPGLGRLGSTCRTVAVSVAQASNAGVRAWNRFWFEADGYAQMRLFRQSFCALMFACYVLRTFDLELFFSDSGLTPLAIFPDVMDMRYRYSLLTVFTGKAALWGAHLLFLGCIIAMGLGFFQRIASLAAAILHVSFLHRNMAIVYGVDLISTFFFLYLSLADPRRSAPKGVDLRSILGSLAFRLCQIQVCIIYGYSGLEKLKGTHWWAGEAIWDVLANAQLARWDFSWLADFPLAIVGATYATLLWEVYFPVIVWQRKLKAPWLAFGVLLHLGIGITMSIPFFGGLMVVAYVLFLEKEWVLHFFPTETSSSKRRSR
jgi:hypothetical protein